jgi:hypothetical protein
MTKSIAYNDKYIAITGKQRMLIYHGMKSRVKLVVVFVELFEFNIAISHIFKLVRVIFIEPI